MIVAVVAERGVRGGEAAVGDDALRPAVQEDSGGRPWQVQDVETDPPGKHEAARRYVRGIVDKLSALD